MAVKSIRLDEFLSRASHAPVLDVRSPAEYLHAHIPGAVSFPLFTDEERKEIGTAYKQVSRQDAVKIGLRYFGPRMLQMIADAEKLARVHKDGERTLLVHCWRGGMRSAGVAWLLDLYGFDVYTLSGGYKAYRTRMLETLALPFEMKVLGGFTGSGKTEVLETLKRNGKPVLNLEALAAHKGSSFGALGQQPQVSQEMFENLLAEALIPFFSRPAGNGFQQPEPIWVEDESIRLGFLNIPVLFFRNMLAQPLYFLDIPFEERLQFIISQYGHFRQEQLVSAILRIQKRLGGLDTKNAVQLLLEKDIAGCFRILLRYYDKQYRLALEKQSRGVFMTLQSARVDPVLNAALCIHAVK